MAAITRYINTASSGGDGTTNGESGATAAYASMSAWEAAEQTDLTSTPDIHTVNCSVGSGSAADTTAVVVAGWTTDATGYIVIQANATDSQKAQVPLDTSRYRLHFTVEGAGTTLTIDAGYTVFNNMQFKITRTGQSAQDTYAFWIDSASPVDAIECHRCVFVHEYNNALDSGTNATSRALFAQDSDDGVFRNCFGYKEQGSTGEDGPTHLFGVGFSRTGNVFDNCTMVIGVDILSAASACRVSTDTVNVVATNCIADVSGVTSVTPDGFRSDGLWTGSNYNASTEADAPGANSRNSQTFTFVNAAGGDYHLTVGDAGARTYGDDLSGTFTDDFDEETRVAWDIGADEVLATSQIGALVNTVRLKSKLQGLVN